jgi:hypothetical protein
MSISIFSSKRTWATNSSKETFRTDCQTADEARKKTDELLRHGHDINGVIEDYDAPLVRQYEPSRVRKLTEVYGTPKKRR